MKKPYRVNILNNKGKEVWRYFWTIHLARYKQSIAKKRGLVSLVYKRDEDQWINIPEDYCINIMS